MSSRAVVAGLLACVAFAAGCQAEPDDGASNEVEAPADSTPAADATEGIAPALAEFYTQALEWETCREEFQCATATVPLDYADPGGETIELALLRAPATGPDRLGSLLVNPGGPGGSGVEYATLADTVVTDVVRERYDIVGFDPRGVGESTPIDCVDDAELDDYLAGDATPDDDAELAEMQQATADFVAGCEARSGGLMAHVGTMDVARDLDVLRAALGDSALNYLGKSYGTYIGALYADLFPSRVGRLVLDGAVDPSLSGQDVGLGQVRGFERAFSTFLAWCFDQDDCVLGSSEDGARRAIRDLLATADQEPLPTEDDTRPLTESLAFYGLLLPLYLTADQGYPPLNEALGLALDENDGTLLLAFADIYFERTEDGAYNGNQNEVIGVVNCFDHPENVSVEQARASLPSYEEASDIFGPYLAWGGLGCSAFDLPPSVPEPVTADGAAPILVVGTTGDPATPYEWAEGLAAQLASGVLLTYEGSVHTGYLVGSDCVDGAVDAYLLDGTVPEEGSRCSS